METKRYILISLIKICAIILISIVLFIVGTMVGYGVVGDGKMSDVFQVQTWAHILDFLK